MGRFPVRVCPVSTGVLILIGILLIPVAAQAATPPTSENGSATPQASASSTPEDAKKTIRQRVVATGARVVRAAGGVLRRMVGAPSDDTAAPTSQIDSPAPGSTLTAGDPVSVQGTAVDFGGGSVARVEVSVDGGKTWQAATGRERWTFTFVPATPGSLQLQSRAVDTGGNVETAVTAVTLNAVQSFGTSKLMASTTSSPTSSSDGAPASTGNCGKTRCTDSTLADFQAGTFDDKTAAVEETGDGGVILKPELLADFAALPAGWAEIEPLLGGGSVSFSNGTAIVENAYAHPLLLQSRPRALEFKATFTGRNQFAGLGITFDTPSWARFATDVTGNFLRVETTNGLDTPLSMVVNFPNLIGQAHVYRIEWTNAGVEYFVDGTSVGTPHSIVILNDMHPIIRDSANDGAKLIVDWMRMGPYPTSGTFHSRVFDRNREVLFTTASWEENISPAFPTNLCVRVGKTPTPDATWSPFACALSGASTTSVNINRRGRYAQYRATLTGDTTTTPELLSVILFIDPCSTVLPCDDGVECTVDSCMLVINGDEIPNTDPLVICDQPDGCPVCVNAPNDAVCQDDIFCDGAEVCDPFQGCVDGPPATCDDGIACTDDVCDTTLDTCVANPVNVACDDGQACTDDVCNVLTGCSNPPSAAGTVCRGAAGVCDVAETCNGTDGTCPADAKSTAVCNPAAGQCDVAESCNGTSNDCPANAFKPAGTSCDDGAFCTTADVCNGSGACSGTTNSCSDGNACTPDSCNETTDTCTHGSAPPEVCNGADDNCNGKIDETFPRLKMTGGGQILHNNQKRTFGFNAKGTTGGKDKGESNYLNHSTKVHLQGEVTQIFYGCSCEMKFKMRTKNGCNYFVTVKDVAEPGRNKDTYGLEFDPANPAFCPKETTAGPKLISEGNIQCHSFKDQDEDDDDHGDCEDEDDEHH